MKFIKCLFIWATLAGLAGCTGWGAKTVPIDRADYIDAVARSSKEQILNNLLRFRYADVTAFVDLEQIVSGYTYGGTLGVDVLPDNFANTAEIGGTLRYEGRPTLTYTPLNGRAFYNNILTPIPPEAIFAVIRAGWPVDLVLGTTIQKINRVTNGIGVGRYRKPPDKRFWQMVELIEKLYAEGALDFRISDDPISPSNSAVKAQDTTRANGKTLLWLEDTAATKRTLLEIDNLKRILGLDPQIEEFELLYGRVSDRPNQIIVMTRSIMTILASFAAEIEIPQEHIDAGRAQASIPKLPETKGLPLELEWAVTAPRDAFVKTKYQGYWFWIDDRNYPTKRTFSFLSLLFSLSDRGVSARPPLVTIPAN